MERRERTRRLSWDRGICYSLAMSFSRQTCKRSCRDVVVDQLIVYLDAESRDKDYFVVTMSCQDMYTVGLLRTIGLRVSLSLRTCMVDPPFQLTPLDRSVENLTEVHEIRWKSSPQVPSLVPSIIPTCETSITVATP